MRTPGEILAFLADFGLAKSVATGSKLTRTGEALGTPAYMSPEQARGEVSALGPGTDVWSLGCVLHEMLAGRPPFGGPTPAAVVAEILLRMPPPIRSARGDVPPEVGRVLRAALAKAPAARYRDAAAFRDDLDRVARGERPRARRFAGPGALRWIVFAAAAGAAALGALLAAGGGPPAAGPATPAASPSEAERLAEGARRLRSTSPAEARDLLAAALRAEPGRHDWRLEHGLLLWGLGRGDLAHVEWVEIPSSAPEAAAARLYSGLEAFFRLAKDQRRESLEFAASRGGREGRLARGTLEALAGRWAEAREALRGAAGWEAALLRACVEGRSKGDPAAEAREYEAAAAEGPPLAWVHNNRGEALREIGDFAGALAAYARALEMAPGFDLPAINRCRALLRRDGAAPTLPEIEEVLHRHPGSAAAWHIAGVCRRDAGDTAGAMRAYDEALRLDPAMAECLDDRGIARVDAGDRVGALADHTAALDPRPGTPKFLQNRAVVRFELGDFPGCIEDCDERLRTRPRDADALAVRAAALASLRRYHEALEDVRAALAADPENRDALLNRGCIRDQTGDLAGAAEDFGALLRRDPADLAVRRNRAGVRERAGDLDGALADLAEILLARPEDPSALRTRASVRMKREEWAAAAADLTAYLRSAPEDPVALANRGVARLQGGDVAGAVADQEAAIRVRPGFVSAHANLGHARRAAGDARGAAEAFREFLRLAPHHARAEEYRQIVADLERR